MQNLTVCALFHLCSVQFPGAIRPTARVKQSLLFHPYPAQPISERVKFCRYTLVVHNLPIYSFFLAYFPYPVPSTPHFSSHYAHFYRLPFILALFSLFPAHCFPLSPPNPPSFHIPLCFHFFFHLIPLSSLFSLPASSSLPNLPYITVFV